MIPQGNPSCYFFPAQVILVSWMGWLVMSSKDTCCSRDGATGKTAWKHLAVLTLPGVTLTDL